MNPIKLGLAARCAVVPLLLFEAHLASAVQTPASVSNSVPFQPQLVENNDPLCASLLEEVRRRFRTPDDWTAADLKVAGLTSSNPAGQDPADQADPNFKPDEDNPEKYTLSIGNGPKVFVTYVNLSGCGGACESELVAVSANPEFDGRPGAVDRSDPNSVVSPQAQDWVTLRDSRSRYYIIGTIDGTVAAYRLGNPKKPWQASCRVSREPTDESLSADTRTRAITQSIAALDDAADAMAGGGGECGTMQTSGRWAFDRKRALLQTLYRPWASHSVGDAASANSYGDVDRIKGQLFAWSLGGLGEHRVFKRYIDQRDATASALSTYYQQVFAWDARRAQSTAVAGLDIALAHGFGFYDYDPYPAAGEAELRQALLEHRPMSQVRAIQFDAGELDRKGSTGFAAETDSVLNVAVEYPEALRYLLSKGVDPNLPNAFGKTPLMYAVQDNQLDSAMILLDAGANVNAATIQPFDRCTYPLRNSHVTALHYAVRNASTEIIQLLLAHGASTSLRARVAGSDANRAVEWLNRYAPGGDATDTNPNLTLADLPMLRRSLQPPSPQESVRIGHELALKAEASYAAGHIQTALGTLEAALAADPNNEKALNDLPLVALHAGNNGLSLATSKRIIESAKSPAARAAAWFNTGLACEHTRIVIYDGVNYCSGDLTEPFLRSWQEQPTTARADKIRETLRIMRSSGDTGHFESCAIGSASSPDGFLQSYIVLGPQVVRWYLWERGASQVTSSTVEVGKWGADSAPVAPKLVLRVDLGGDSISIMETRWTGTGSAGLLARVKGQQCHLY